MPGEPAPEKGKLQSLADLFREDEAPAEGAAPESGADDGAQPEKGKKPPKALKDLAERLGLTPESLYAVEIPLASGKSMTLGKLKDAAARDGDVTVRELAFEESRTRKESELLRAQAELRELVQALPPNAVKPEVVEALRKRHDNYLTTERARTLEVIPEWQDEDRRAVEIEQLVEHLKGYGFPSSYLQTVHDHRILKYIRDNWQRAERIRRALEQVESGKPSTPAPSRGGNGKVAPRKPSESPRPKFHDRRAALLKILE